MKKKNALAELTLEELQTKQKKLNGVVIGLGIVMAAALITLIYTVTKTKNYTLLILVFVLPITLLPTLIYLNQLSTEIKSRNSKQL